MKVLNFGSMNLDYVYQVEHIMRPGETQTSLSRNVFCGGKGLNQSIALARAGVEVYHAGSIGDDGDSFLTLFAENQVDTSYVARVAGPSGHTIIQIDAEGQNCIMLFPGANRRQTKAHIDEVLNHFEAGDYLLLQNEINELDYIIDTASKKGMKIVLNPSPFDSYLKDCNLHAVSIFLINELEGAALAGSEDPDQILDAMKEKYPQASVVLTLGSKGAMYQDEQHRIFRESDKVIVVDTTAAGDTFTGYFIAGLLAGKEPEEILRISTRASGIAVSRAGAAASIPFAEEVLG